MRITILVITLIISMNSHAADWLSDITLSPTPMSYTGPSDSIKPGSIIGSAWSSVTNVERVFQCVGFFNIGECQRATIQPSGSAIPSGMTVDFDGKNYTIFETGVAGIGYIIGVKDYNATSYIPLQLGISQTYPAEGTASRATYLGWTAKVTFVKTGTPLKSGVYQVPANNAAVMTAYQDGGKTGISQLNINPTTITVSASGCTVNTKSANINLGTVDVHSLTAIGSASQPTAFNINLTCDPGISLYAVMTDQSMPSNASSVVTLTGGSTASGIGVQFLYNGSEPVMLGPDSSSSNTLNQFYINSIESAQVISLPFQAQYIRTGKLVPGTANSLASITFSYQ